MFWRGKFNGAYYCRRGLAELCIPLRAERILLCAGMAE